MAGSSDSKNPPRKLGRGIGALISMPAAVEVPVVPPPTPVEPVVVEVKPTVDAVATDAIRYIELGSIVPSPYQPRRSFDPVAISQLAESIRHSGVMQPIIVRQKATGFELVAGERRWRAAQASGIQQIPAIVRSLSDEQSAEWALVENVQREDLNPIDRGMALKALTSQFGISQSQIAERLGIERSSVANLIRLTELETEIAGLIARGELTAGHGKALLSIPPGEARLNLAREAAAGAWNVRKTELLAQAHAIKPENVGTKAQPKAEAEARQAVLRDLERQIGHHLGTKVLITTDRTGSKGKLSIEFYSIDHFDGLLRKLGVSTH